MQRTGIRLYILKVFCFVSIKAHLKWSLHIDNSFNINHLMNLVSGSVNLYLLLQDKSWLRTESNKQMILTNNGYTLSHLMNSKRTHLLWCLWCYVPHTLLFIKLDGVMTNPLPTGFTTLSKKNYNKKNCDTWHLTGDT